MSAADTVRAYKDLARVEQAFRTMKSIDLQVRPVHHWIEPRVRAHVFLCMLGYHVEWHSEPLGAAAVALGSLGGRAGGHKGARLGRRT